MIGYGGAGAAAAIMAHDAGARVLVIEKTESGGGSTRYSGGFFASPRSAEGAADYLMYCGRAADGHHFDMDRASLVTWAEEARHNAEWIGALGGDPFVTLRGWYDVPGAEDFQIWQPRPDATGVGLWRVLDEAVSSRGIEVIYNAPGSELVTREVSNADGTTSAEVLGVVAETGAGRIAIRAARGVILTTGGFDFDETMKQSYMRSYPIYSTGHTGNTGDAIKLASRTGAALWRLTGTSANVCHKFDGVAVAYPSSLQLSAAARSVIMVDRNGRRFINEALPYDAVAKSLDHFDAASQSYPRNPCWLVFDETTRLAGPAGLPIPIGAPEYTWSANNSEEIAKGWILEAGSVTDLAAAMEVDAQTLDATVVRYNDGAREGRDPDFGRTMGLRPLEGTKFYALKGYPGLWATGGGPRNDTSARVLDTSGRPVPRLYAAGSASSFCFSFLYPSSGTAIGDCLAMGRIAGRHAGAINPW
ncbi:MAG: FAD-binding protein [Gemmobacter sp.]|nr:FAD-binding protein [Gemmobacter sp.]